MVVDGHFQIRTDYKSPTVAPVLTLTSEKRHTYVDTFCIKLLFPVTNEKHEDLPFGEMVSTFNKLELKLLSYGPTESHFIATYIFLLGNIYY